MKEAAVEVQNQSRISLTISDKDFVPGLSLIGWGGPMRCFPTFAGRTHGWLRSSAIACSSPEAVAFRLPARGAISRATGLPREVTTTSWPALALRRYSDRRLFSSRTEISMCVPNVTTCHIVVTNEGRCRGAQSVASGSRLRAYARRMQELEAAPEDFEIEAIEPAQRTAPRSQATGLAFASPLAEDRVHHSPDNGS